MTTRKFEKLYREWSKADTNYVYKKYVLSNTPDRLVTNCFKLDYMTNLDTIVPLSRSRYDIVNGNLVWIRRTFFFFNPKLLKIPFFFFHGIYREMDSFEVHAMIHLRQWIMIDSGYQRNIWALHRYRQLLTWFHLQ